jgi:membrane protein YqaA with SNARE-associated domain
MRGLAVAMMMLTGNFFGSLTAYVIGVVQDSYDNGAHSLKWILLVKKKRSLEKKVVIYKIMIDV